jgi:hypothetical protein
MPGRSWYCALFGLYFTRGCAWAWANFRSRNKRREQHTGKGMEWLKCLQVSLPCFRSSSTATVSHLPLLLIPHPKFTLYPQIVSRYWCWSDWSSPPSVWVVTIWYQCKKKPQKMTTTLPAKHLFNKISMRYKDVYVLDIWVDVYVTPLLCAYSGQTSMYRTCEGDVCIS